METQYQANGRHRVLYEPRRDPVVQQHALELGAHCARVVLEGVAAVSPNQRDPDGHRLLVASELTKAMLAEVYRMVGAVAGWAIERQFAAGGHVAGAAQTVAPPPRRAVQAQPRAQRRAQPAQPRRVPTRAVVNRRGF